MRWLTGLCISFCSLVLVLLAGCSGPDSRPSGVLPPDKMQAVLWDMIEADQYSLLYLARDSARINVKAETAARYEQVFELHKISKSEFEKSIKYYFSRPDIAKPLFDSLSAMGIRKRTEDYKNNRPGTTPMHTPAAPAIPAAVPGKATVLPHTLPPGHGPLPPGHGPLPPGHGPLSPGHAPPASGNLPVHSPGNTPKNSAPVPQNDAHKTAPPKIRVHKTGTHKTDSAGIVVPKP